MLWCAFALCLNASRSVFFRSDGGGKTTSEKSFSHAGARAIVKNKFTHTGVVDVVFLDSKQVRNSMNSHSVQKTSFNIVFHIVGVCAKRVLLHAFHVSYVARASRVCAGNIGRRALSTFASNQSLKIMRAAWNNLKKAFSGNIHRTSP